MTRALILVATITIFVCLLLDRPKPVKSAQVVPYCVITYPAAVKDAQGNWHKGWARGYGPCSQLDRFENI
jgi:hypothetical protein